MSLSVHKEFQDIYCQGGWKDVVYNISDFRISISDMVLSAVFCLFDMGLQKCNLQKRFYVKMVVSCLLAPVLLPVIILSMLVRFVRCMIATHAVMWISFKELAIVESSSLSDQIDRSRNTAMSDLSVRDGSARIGVFAYGWIFKRIVQGAFIVVLYAVLMPFIIIVVTSISIVLEGYLVCQMYQFCGSSDVLSMRHNDGSILSCRDRNICYAKLSSVVILAQNVLGL